MTIHAVKHFTIPLVALITVIGILAILSAGCSSSKTANSLGSSDTVGIIDTSSKVGVGIVSYDSDSNGGYKSITDSDDALEETLSIDAVDAINATDIITTIDTNAQLNDALEETLSIDAVDAINADGITITTIDTNAQLNDALEETVSIDAVDAINADGIITTIDTDTQVNDASEETLSIDAVDAINATGIIITTIDTNAQPNESRGSITNSGNYDDGDDD